MKKLSTTLILLALVAGVFSTPYTAAAQNVPPVKNSAPPGIAIAQTLSTITGVAISPLLGVGGVGCYQYFKAKSAEERARLPWFANPLFWVPALLLVAACAAKDCAGVVLPPGVKKPVDALETLEHKISSLVATGAFVPIMVNIIHQSNPTGGQPGASLSSLGLAVVDWHNIFYNLLVTPVAMVAFILVCLASNAINILILLSPFGALDAGLKTFRTTIMASVAVSAWTNPWIGMMWALFIILFSYLIAGWSFRLSHFGLVFIWDYFTGRKHRFHPDSSVNSLFLSRKINKVPARTYGKLQRNAAGELVLTYRPWLVLPLRTLTLPAGSYGVGRGLFYSEILWVEGESGKTLILLPPRYLGHEEEVAEIYQFVEVRDVGIRAAWAWFKSLFGASRAAAT